MAAQANRRTGFTRLSAGFLPIHAAVSAGYAIFYAPRLICVLNEVDAPAVLNGIERLASEPLRSVNDSTASPPAVEYVTAELVRAAHAGAREVAERHRQPFNAQCLTLYVNNRCNLRCRYCYSQPGGLMHETLSAAAAQAASRLVAEMCAAEKTPFTLAVHGGGEPTLDKPLVDRLLDTAEEEADRSGVPLRTYIATNGVVPDETAQWLAKRFDLVGVSCDGPPELQDRHRPGRDGRPRSEQVERTIFKLQQHGRPYHIRATISRETINRQAEIVSYLADRYTPNEIRLEPVYANPSGEEPLSVSHAPAFVLSFLSARAAGAARGVPVTTSITRPDEVYGPYCNVLRQVLNLVPGDVGTACFLSARADEVVQKGIRTAGFDSNRVVFHVDAARTRCLIARCSARPEGCDDCLCSCQCTYGCPDRCALEGSGTAPLSENDRGSFRCLVNRMLMERLIIAAADQAWTGMRRGYSRREDTNRHRSMRVVVCREGTVGEVRSW